MKNLAILLAFVCSLQANLWAFSADNLRAELAENIEQIKQILSTPSAEKSSNLYNLLEPHLDKKLMLHLVLSPHQKEAPKEFSELFFRLLRKDLAGKIDLVNASTLKLISAKSDAKRCKAVASVLYEESQKEISFLFRKVGGECKLYDINVLDVSLLGAYKAQFIDIIEHEGMSALISGIKKTINE